MCRWVRSKEASRKQATSVKVTKAKNNKASAASTRRPDARTQRRIQAVIPDGDSTSDKRSKIASLQQGRNNIIMHRIFAALLETSTPNKPCQ